VLATGTVTVNAVSSGFFTTSPGGNVAVLVNP